MANYCCAIRTNYFRVKDAVKFREMMSRVHGNEDSIMLWEKKDTQGRDTFGFGLYGCIFGLMPEGNDGFDDIDYDEAYNGFINALQECVAEDDAIIIMEAGNAKMRYVVGSALIITSKKLKYIDIQRQAINEAATMMGNPWWTTNCEY